MSLRVWCSNNTLRPYCVIPCPLVASSVLTHRIFTPLTPAEPTKHTSDIPTELETLYRKSTGGLYCRVTCLYTDQANHLIWTHLTLERAAIFHLTAYKLLPLLVCHRKLSFLRMRALQKCISVHVPYNQCISYTKLCFISSNYIHQQQILIETLQ